MRRITFWAGAAVLGAVAGYSALWFEAAHSVRQSLPAWAEARRHEGYAIGWATAETEGFPLAFRLRLTGVTLEAVRPLPYRVEAGEVILSAQPWNLRDWRFDAPRGATVGDPLGAGALQAATVSGTANAGIVHATALTLAGSGLAAGYSASSLTVTATLPDHPPANDRDPLFALDARLADAALPGAPPLARHLDELSLAATVRGALPDAPAERALAQWRDAGGALDVDHARLTAGGTMVELTGTLALDAAMQPEGALTATVTGADKIVDALVAAGSLDERFSGFAKSVLRAIAIQGASGDAIHVPVTVQDQRLYVGPAPIAALPHVTWR